MTTQTTVACPPWCEHSDDDNPFYRDHDLHSAVAASVPCADSEQHPRELTIERWLTADGRTQAVLTIPEAVNPPILRLGPDGRVALRAALDLVEPRPAPSVEVVIDSAAARAFSRDETGRLLVRPGLLPNGALLELMRALGGEQP